MSGLATDTKVGAQVRDSETPGLGEHYEAPSASESDLWARKMEQNRQSTESLIRELSGSKEFTDRRVQF